MCRSSTQGKIVLINFSYPSLPSLPLRSPPSCRTSSTRAGKYSSIANHHAAEHLLSVRREAPHHRPWLAIRRLLAFAQQMVSVRWICVGIAIIIRWAVVWGGPVSQANLHSIRSPTQLVVNDLDGVRHDFADNVLSRGFAIKSLPPRLAAAGGPVQGSKFGSRPTAAWQLP